MKTFRSFLILIVLCGEMTIFLLSCSTEKTPQEANAPQLVLPIGHTGFVNSVAFSSDGEYALSGAWDKTMKLWVVNTGQLLFTRLHANVSDWVVVAPDGRFDGSPDGIKLLHYAKGNKSISIDTSSDPFYTPGLVAQLLESTSEKGKRQL